MTSMRTSAIGAYLILGCTLAAVPYSFAQMPQKSAIEFSADPHVVFDKPKPGQKFAPGDTISIVVRVLPPLKEKVTDAMASIPGMGMLPNPRFDWKNRVFHWSFPIPEEFAGPLTVTPVIVAGMDPAHPDQPLMIVGAPVSVVVQPRNPPNTITLLDHDFIVAWPGCCGPQTEHIYVRGHFGAQERDLTTAESGTTYRSSNPSVALVSRDGEVRVVGPGLATITVENRGARDFASITVEDPVHPLPPQDLSALVQFTRTTAVFDPEAKAYRAFPMMVQTVTIQNTSSEVIVGPLYLMVSNVADGVQLWGNIRNAPANPPPNMLLYSRYQMQGGKPAAIWLDPRNGLSLKPGEQLSQQIYFLLSAAEAIVPDVSLGLVRSGRQP